MQFWWEVKMKTIFIAENNRDHLKMLRKWIEGEFSDIQLLTAKTFLDGRDIVENNHIDLFILDIGLTNEDDEQGVQLAEEIREKYPHNTIIFQTVQSDHKYQVDIHSRIGSAIYLVKQELSKERLIATIHHELDRFAAPLTSFIFIKERSERTLIPTHQIFRIEKVNNGHDAVFFLYDKKSDGITTKIFRISLTGIMDQAGARGFLLRCHQSHIINQKMMEGVTVEESMYKVKIEHEDELIPIGRNYRDKTLKALGRMLKK